MLRKKFKPSDLKYVRRANLTSHSVQGNDSFTSYHVSAKDLSPRMLKDLKSFGEKPEYFRPPIASRIGAWLHKNFGWRGLGDVVESFTKKTGIKKAVGAVERVTEKPCGCGKRRASLNKMFPFMMVTENESVSPDREDRNG